MIVGGLLFSVFAAVDHRIGIEACRKKNWHLSSAFVRKWRHRFIDTEV